MIKNKALVRAFDLAQKFNEQHKLGARLPETGIFAKGPDLKAGSLYIYDEIMPEWWPAEWGGLKASTVVKALEDLRGVKTLNVYINSPGGDVFGGKAILTNLQRFEGEKVVHVDGIAASAATFIAMAGDRIVTASHANWMIHEASSMAFGRAEDMRAQAEVLDLANRDMAELYAKQTGKSVDEMLEAMAAETWFSAAEALDFGLTDEVYEPEKDEEKDAKATAARSPLVAAALSTEEQTRFARAGRRVQEFTKSRGASPAPARPASR